MNELERCPCCGTEAVINTDEDSFYKLVGKNGSACVCIECTNRSGCGITQFCHYDSNNYEVILPIAIERWNRRAVAQSELEV